MRGTLGHGQSNKQPRRCQRSGMRSLCPRQPGSLRCGFRAPGDRGGHHAATAAWSPTGMPTAAGGRPAADRQPTVAGTSRAHPPVAGTRAWSPAANSSPVGLVGQRGRARTAVRLAGLNPHIRSPWLTEALVGTGLIAARSMVHREWRGAGGRAGAEPDVGRGERPRCPAAGGTSEPRQPSEGRPRWGRPSGPAERRPGPFAYGSRHFHRPPSLRLGTRARSQAPPRRRDRQWS